MKDKPVSLWRQTVLPSLGLFTSVGTLLCCALPALLVTLGMGTALAGFVGAVPWITAISDYKTIVFAVAGILIVSGAVMQWQARNALCPTDPARARACSGLRKVNRIILGIAAILYGIGFFFTFVAVHIFY